VKLVAAHTVFPVLLIGISCVFKPSVLPVPPKMIALMKLAWRSW